MKKIATFLVVALMAATGLAQNSLDVNANAAHMSNFGLEVITNTPGNPVFVTDNTPDGETLYRASFWFNTNNLPLTNGQAHFIFQTKSPNPDTGVGLVDHLQLEMRKRALGNSSRLRLGAWYDNQNAPKRLYTPFIALTQGDWHRLQVEWRPTTSNVTGSVDGLVRLSVIDGPNSGQVVELDGVIKDKRLTVDRAQLGLLTGFDGAVGSYYLDSFESYRTLAP